MYILCINVYIIIYINYILIPFSLLPPAHLCFQLGHLLLPQGPGRILRGTRNWGRALRLKMAMDG